MFDKFEKVELADGNRMFPVVESAAPNIIYSGSPIKTTYYAVRIDDDSGIEPVPLEYSASGLEVLRSVK